MRILVYGSLNFDDDYEMEHFVKPGETAAPLSYKLAFGGKGLNQAIALANAGMDTAMAGRIGEDGLPLREYLDSKGVDTSFIAVDPEGRTGRAVIQIAKGENSIILFGGTNACIDPEDVRKTFDSFGPGDALLIQNEISNLPLIIKCAKEKGMTVIFNVSPVSDDIACLPLESCDLLFVNEIEGAFLSETYEKKTGTDAEKMPVFDSEENENAGTVSGDKENRSEAADKENELKKPLTPREKLQRENEILAGKLAEMFSDKKIVLTLGSEGSYFLEKGDMIYQQAFRMKPVDTTAAGDTYTGYFLETYFRTGSAKQALMRASFASSLAVMKTGAGESIPTAQEVDRGLLFLQGTFQA